MPASISKIKFGLLLLTTLLFSTPALATSLEYPLPGQEKEVTSPAAYVKSLYEFGVIAAGILAVLMVMLGGFLYMTAGGNPGGVEKGKNLISGALWGVVLLLSSYVILYTIDPGLTRLDFELPEINLEEPTKGNSIPNRVTGTVGPSGYDEMILRIAAETGVDPALLKAIIKVESNFSASAKSHAGAMGLMQLMPGTARDLGVDDPWDPEQNVTGGANYVKTMLKRYNGDVRAALIAYNWGPGNYERTAGLNVMPTETRKYINLVQQYYEQIKNSGFGR